jgi:hypothetical protein
MGSMAGIAVGVFALAVLMAAGANGQSDSQKKYRKMAPIDEYLMNRDGRLLRKSA